MSMNKNMRLLIVDDFPSMRKTLADILRAAGLRDISFAEDGVIAWRKLQEERFDFILLDWDMPNMNGIELLRKIRQDPRFNPIPVLMVTAEAEQAKVVEAVSTGVNNYIVKPYTPNTVFRKLQEIFGKSE